MLTAPFRRGAVLAAALLMPPAAARAVLLNGVDATSGIVPGEPMVGTVLGAMMLNALPSEPMGERPNTVKAAAGAYRFTRDIPTDGSGGSGGANNGAFSESQGAAAGAAGYLRSFGPHWGLSVTAVGADSRGTSTKRLAYQVTANGPVRDRGAALGVGAVYDPFSDPEGFRLPMTVGATIASVYGKRGPYSFTFPIGTGAGLDGHAGEADETYSKTVPGGYLGLAPQGNVGPVRWTAFFFVAFAGSPDNVYTERDLTAGRVGGSTTSSGSLDSANAALQLTYRPWDLSLQYLTPVSRGQTSGTLTGLALAWAKRW